MKLLLLYWGIMILCYIAAYKLRSRRDSFGFMGGALNAVIFILVFIMGLRMGANEEVTSSLGTIGVQAVLITVFTVCGSMAAVTALRKILGLNRQGAADNMPEAKLEAQLTEAEYAETQLENELESQLEKETAENKEEKGGAAKTTVLILVCVAAGMALGYLMIPRLFADTAVFQEMSGTWLVAGICVLLGLVGFNLGLDGSVIRSLKTAGIKVILVPLAAIAGSLLFGALYGLISPLTVREAVSVSAGFGWYTFAPGVIAEAGHAVAGAVSFMHNVIRETLGIIIIPLAAQKIGYLEATAIPGVAAMDVCLPIVERSCRPETVVYSFCMGMIMSVAVPLLVPLFIG